VTITPPGTRSAATRTRPAAGFPAATRTAGGSTPWSTALRRRCVSGSPSASRTPRSTAASPPGGLERDLAAGGARGLARHPRQPVEQLRERHESGLDDGRLQRLRDARDVLHGAGECRVGGVGSGRGEPAARGRQLAR
jgi:hypothetical protein